MKFVNTEIENVYVVDLDLKEDERGFFARSWCETEFRKRGLNNNIVQCNISYNNIKGTIRGMHLQTKPYEEAKLVRCTRGSVFDVLIDLREYSKTFKKWVSVILNRDNRKMVYIPEGVAHGFQTLENDTEVFYQMSEFYHPECAIGFRWDDPAFEISWPLEPSMISEKDMSYQYIENST